MKWMQFERCFSSQFSFDEFSKLCLLDLSSLLIFLFVHRRVPAWKRATFLRLHSLWCKSGITHGFFLKIIVHKDRQIEVEIFCQVR